jgi:hypothetical protein
MVLAPFLFLFVPLSAVHALPRGVPLRPTPKVTGWNLWKGAQTRVAEESATRRGAWLIQGTRTCARKAGGLERVALNADRIPNRKGASLFDGFPHDASSNSQLRIQRVIPQAGGRLTRADAATMVIARLIYSPFHGPSDAGSSP